MKTESYIQCISLGCSCGLHHFVGQGLPQTQVVSLHFTGIYLITLTSSKLRQPQFICPVVGIVMVWLNIVKRIAFFSSLLPAYFLCCLLILIMWNVIGSCSLIPALTWETLKLSYERKLKKLSFFYTVKWRLRQYVTAVYNYKWDKSFLPRKRKAAYF